MHSIGKRQESVRCDRSDRYDRGPTEQCLQIPSDPNPSLPHQRRDQQIVTLVGTGTSHLRRSSSTLAVPASSESRQGFLQADLSRLSQRPQSRRRDIVAVA